MIELLFETFNVSAMNETDVREAIVRPLLKALGYSHGTAANIRTEYTLQYDRAFLGRKDRDKDPKLRGRADYICEVIPYGRWIVEVKSPAHELTLDDAQQARTYAAHPEIAARFYLLTNGREFKIYQTSSPASPLVSWRLEQTNCNFQTVVNLLGPEAIKRSGQIVLDRGRSLAPGLGSSARITGGSMTYSDSWSNNETLIAAMGSLKGLRNAARGHEISRTADGLIEARIELEPAFSAFDELNRTLGFIPISFKCPDEVLSIDRSRPSIFTNVLRLTLPRGTVLPTSPVSPGGILQIDCSIVYYNNAAGWLEGTKLSGTFTSEQDFQVHGSVQSVRHWGRFELIVS
ncbi:type I restriction enzyme HsdR N-terminal domain-containing protein [Bradyrhizobium sp. WSM 1704]|uniref:type I restriction enzyme HsdR N-terminal domain-containing protein n=1 Tax=Bradyrhizobium semiaridum TaxID=2821404 RepID=UPI001CE35C0B|nr:type I restriction enzyme HsdR N-terminal domain-containing protein [Bradyrhizobium semiaridum]MCA6123533.1 type I restriction enzyme HsdR N-terminal domain-containing protein [Bradyrhizobium semiaridum]